MSVALRHAILFFALAQPAVLAAQDTFQNVEYISGKNGFEHKEKGVLTVGSEDLVFADSKGHIIFVIKVASVTKVSNDAQVRDASFGSKMLLGSFAGSRKQEYVTVTSETDSTAEGIEFKVKEGTSPNIVAKIQFAVKKATGKPLKEATDTTKPADSK